MHKDLERRASMLHTRVNPSPPTPLPPQPAILQPSSKETEGRVMTPLLRAVGKGEPHRTVPCDSWQGHLSICMLQNDQSGKNMTDTTGNAKTVGDTSYPRGPTW